MIEKEILIKIYWAHYIFKRHLDGWTGFSLPKNLQELRFLFAYCRKLLKKYFRHVSNLHSYQALKKVVAFSSDQNSNKIHFLLFFAIRH